MWGQGGRFYWRRKNGKEEGIVVLFAWLSSEERNLRAYVDLYWSLGWSCLVCHVDFLTLFFPDKATSLACGVLNELIKEVKIRQLPIVLTAFSGGSKGCLYKILQLAEGRLEGQLSQDDCQLVRDCICGQIYDSSPVDFTSDLGTRFVLHPSVLKVSQPPRVVTWMAKAFASGLDTLFLSRFEAQRAEYWQTLYSSVNTGPFLIFCSEDDDLHPYQISCNFAQRLQELGGDVKLVRWSNSPHVAHYKYHQADYKVAVTELLSKAAIVYSRRQRLNGETTAMGVCNLHEAAVSSNQSLRRVATGPSDHFFLPSSMELGETSGAAGSVATNEQKGELFHLPTNINPHGVLGQILFDVCVPKNIEGWDIKPMGSSNGRQTFGSTCRYGPFNPIKCIRRSRL